MTSSSSAGRSGFGRAARPDSPAVQMVRALRSWVDPSGVVVNAGDEFNESHPIVRGRPHLFVPAHVPVEVLVEQATAAPGEVRRTTRTKAAR